MSRPQTECTQPLEMGIGKVSTELRRAIKQLSDHAAQLTETVVGALCVSIPEYSDIHDPATLQDIRETVGYGVRLWYHTLLTGKSPSPRNLEPFAARARNRVHQGIPLSSFLQAFRLSSRYYWDALLQATQNDPAVSREVLLKVSPYVLYYFDLLGQQVSQSYSDELCRRVQWRDRLRADLCDIIFNRPADLGNFREQALALGIDAGAAHLALSVRLDESPTHPQGREAATSDALSLLAKALKLSSEIALYTHHQGYLLTWLPLQAGESAGVAERRLLRDLAALLKQSSPIRAVGLGLPAARPLAWRSSAEQAMRAVEVGMRLTTGTGVFRYLDIALEDSVFHSETLSNYFDELLARLSAEPQLIETLQIYFKHRQQRKVAAGVLNIHPNTLTYRLGRIESLLDARLDDTACIAALHTALRLRHLSRQVHR